MCLQTKLIQQGKQIYKLWVQSHAGIKGSEQADHFAMQGPHPRTLSIIQHTWNELPKKFEKE